LLTTAKILSAQTDFEFLPISPQKIGPLRHLVSKIQNAAVDDERAVAVVTDRPTLLAIGVAPRLGADENCSFQRYPTARRQFCQNTSGLLPWQPQISWGVARLVEEELL
jgi:hypothetical protein